MDPIDQKEQLLDAWLALAEDGVKPQPGPIRLPVLTGSMLPEVPVGSFLHIEKIESRHCRNGDLVIYRMDDRLVAHRVLLRLGWNNSWVIFEKGDNTARGHWILGRRIRGRAVAVERAGQPPLPLATNPKLARQSLWADILDRLLVFPRHLKQLIRGSGD